MTKVELLL